jgi:uncharacterized membrane protein
MKLAAYLLVFWAMQVIAYVAFKYGSHGETGRSKRWLTGFIGGNAVGASSIYFLMKIYEAMPGNCNVAMVLSCGGAFVCCQVALAVIFRSRLTWVQWAGVALVAAGSALATLGGPVAGGTAEAGRATSREQPASRDSAAGAGDKPIQEENGHADGR